MLHVNIPCKAVYAWTADATENCQSGDDLHAYVNVSSFFPDLKDSSVLKQSQQTQDLSYTHFICHGPQNVSITLFCNLNTDTQA